MKLKMQTATTLKMFNKKKEITRGKQSGVFASQAKTDNTAYLDKAAKRRKNKDQNCGRDFSCRKTAL